MRDRANHQEVFSYSEYEGQGYDGKLRIGVQPLNATVGAERGSIVEHPHERGTYLIDFVTFPSVDKYNTKIDRVIVVNGDIDILSDIGRSNIEHLVEPVIQLYQKVRETDFIEHNYSFQMEFGIRGRDFPDMNSILFYQARPFLGFQEPPFDVEERMGKYSCFGITPEEGVILPVIRTIRGESIAYELKVNEIDEDFAWLELFMTERMGPNIRPRNLAAFVPIGNRIDRLEHNTFKWVRKAKVSILDPLSKESLIGFQTGDQIKIKSNGLCHKVEKV